ncbi:MAG TPA: sensor domain-containing diguanylate cyclase [Chloroflexia bacterium]|nr:sensor domain-containing diguanylate cyclase [Chloroflexia bacterium]
MSTSAPATDPLASPARLAALRQTALLDSPPEEAFDRLTRLAAHLLGAPIALVSLVDHDRQFFKSAIGLAEPWATARQTPLSYSFCQHVVQARAPFIVEDARIHPLVQDSLTILETGVMAYVGIPLVTSAGEVLGSCCVMDTQPRAWTPAQVALLQDVTAAVVTEIELRLDLQAREAAEQQLYAALARTQALYHTARALIRNGTLADLLQAVVDSTAAALPADRVTLVTLDRAARQVTHLVKGGVDADQTASVAFAELEDGLTGWVVRTGQAALSPQGVPDARESPAVQERRRRTACGAIMVAPLIYQEQVQGTMTAINRAEAPDFTEADLALLVAMADQAATAIANAQLLARVQHLAVTDELTQVANRRGLWMQAQYELGRARRLGRPLTAIVLDIDHFKQVNDTYGHGVGDVVLQEVVARCRSNIRTIDLLGRTGGEEFAILLPETDLAAAGQIAERVREVVAGAPIPTTQGAVEVTISLGVAALPAGNVDLEPLLAQADTALYDAKQAGRNRVVLQRAEG